MKTAFEVLRWTATISFAVIGLLALVKWLRSRVVPAAWLSATFGVLAVLFVVARLLPEGAAERPDWLVKGLVALLVLFPYFLYRFMASFGGRRRALDVFAAAATAAVVVWTIALPSIPETGDLRPVWFQAFLVGLLLQWTLLVVIAASGLWRAGSQQPRVARRRMRLLAFGAVLMTMALLVAAAIPGGEEPDIWRLVTQAIAVASALVFYLGFAPPTLVLLMWRRPAERAMRETELRLMRVVSDEEVAAAILPHVGQLLGGGAAVLADREGVPIAVQGIPHEEGKGLVSGLPVVGMAGEVAAPAFGLVAIGLSNGVLAVKASPYVPFFGQEEIELVRSIAVFADLALERARLFEREREARSALEDLNEELESFVYSVSHDLKTPLISVLGYLDLLKTDAGDELGERGGHYVTRISTSAMYMNQLIYDLLELSRIGRAQTEIHNVELDALCMEIADELGATSPQAGFEFEDLPVVRMNLLRARQLFTNLMGNAVSHAGRPDVTVRVGSQTQPDGSVRIWVSDDGKGIPSRFHEKVFGVFERLEGPGEIPGTGTGVGLAVCKKIVEQVGGSIGLGQPDTGAEVLITLPAEAVRKGATTI